MSEEIFKEEKSITQHDVENKQLKKEKVERKKEENEKVESTKVENEKVESRKVESRKENNKKVRKENEQLRKNDIDAKIKESIEKPKKIKSPEDKNTTDWLDKNKFKKILAIINGNKFNYRNKIKYIDLSILTLETWLIILEIIQLVKHLLKKDLNTLNKIKNSENIKSQKHTPKHKELLNLFNDLLDIILTDKTLMSSKDKNENGNDYEKEDENEDEDEDQDDYENENEDDYENENEDEDEDNYETMNQNEKTK